MVRRFLPLTFLKGFPYVQDRLRGSQVHQRERRKVP